MCREARGEDGVPWHKPSPKYYRPEPALEEKEEAKRPERDTGEEEKSRPAQ